MRLGFGLVRVLLITLAIPAVGYLVSVWIINDVNTDLAKEGIPPIETTCSMCNAPGSLDTSLSHAAGLIEIAACHA